MLIRRTGERSTLGGAIVEASITSLRNGRHFRAHLFDDRVFVLDEMILGGQYLSELRRLRRNIESRATDGAIHVIDAGANVGLFTLFASTVVGPPIRSHGFEPFEENRRLCGRNWRSQGHRVHSAALSDRDAREAVLYVRSTTGATIMSEEPGADDSPVVTVQTARLDTLWPGLGIPRMDVVKLDIEGAEESALAGAAETIAQHRPFILCSYEHEGNSRDALVSLLIELVPDYVVHDDPSRRLLTFEPPDAAQQTD